MQGRFRLSQGIAPSVPQDCCRLTPWCARHKWPLVGGFPGRPGRWARVRAFNHWPVEDGLVRHRGKNWAAFDFYNVLTGPPSSAPKRPGGTHLSAGQGLARLPQRRRRSSCPCTVSRGERGVCSPAHRLVQQVGGLKILPPSVAGSASQKYDSWQALGTGFPLLLLWRGGCRPGECGSAMYRSPLRANGLAQIAVLRPVDFAAEERIDARKTIMYSILRKTPNIR